ncbi:Aste57867_12756 [Aphanomyces stellatus]|uniref:Ribosome biogenesis protein WDR12 homolog n=1 Tax=Aphanomyces stellatus TaxID=120398 RepID=A0A485KWG8_9STRA|nr:hypothetical protein As57867_012708 [Aphanomyces stellatus]VFT89605.1 Aste57867_12756 [Aphanomyces stellatus]
MDDGAQIRVKFVTKNAAIRVTETPFAVPIKLARAGLSQVVNHLLNTATPKPFDFLVDNKFLRTTLEKYVVANNLTDEAVLTLEYVEAHLEPEEKKSENHPDWISAVASNNEVVVTGCYDGIVRVFSSTGQLLTQIKAHDSVIKSIAIQDNVIVTGGKDHQAKLWTLDGKSISGVSAFVGHLNSVDGVAISGDNVLTGSWDNTVRVWTAETDSGDAPDTKKQKTKGGAAKTTMKQEEARVILPGHTAAVLAVAFDPSQAHIVYSASMDRSIKLWDLTTETCTQTMTGSSTLADMSVSGAGMVLSAHPDHSIRLWDPRAAKAGTSLVQATFQSHKQWVSAVKWAPQGHQFVSCGYGGAVKLWDARSSIPLFTLAAHAGKALDVAWLPNTKPAFVSGGEDCQLKFYETN